MIMNLVKLSRFALLAGVLAVGNVPQLNAQPASDNPDPYADETPAQRDARMKWFREARFGLFIHWGVYAVPAGIYHGQEIGNYGEWIMNFGKIPGAEYREFAKQFNPTKFNADEWVALAKQAGMKYLIITSKHHDGFAMFDSKASDWNIVKATPFQRDPLKELAAACQKHGVKLGFYYSQAQDWNNGGAGYEHRVDRPTPYDMDKYIRDIAVPQVREILTGYGPIAVLWWDTPADMNRERAAALLPLLKLQPGIIHNDRLGGGFGGDTSTPEQYIPARGASLDWETCMTMNDTWGFKQNDHNWKSTEILVRQLIDCASKGGNYLLNVGPTAEGLIPAPSVERLKAVGDWMKINGEAIYATTGSPFARPFSWGRCTTKTDGKTTTLYLHVFDWPSDGELLVPGLQNKVAKASLLAGGKKLKTKTTADGVLIHVPKNPPAAISTTIVLRITEPLQVSPYVLTQNRDGTIALPAMEVRLHGKTFKYESGGALDNIGFWSDPQDWAEWEFKVNTTGKFEVTAVIAAPASGTFDVVVGDKTLRGASPVTANYFDFKPVKLGVVEISKTGKTTLAVRPVTDQWQPLNLRSIQLKPVAAN
jgi:alpha-L-fucosidase